MLLLSFYIILTSYIIPSPCWGNLRLKLVGGMLNLCADCFRNHILYIILNQRISLGKLFLLHAWRTYLNCQLNLEALYPLLCLIYFTFAYSKEIKLDESEYLLFHVVDSGWLLRIATLSRKKEERLLLLSIVGTFPCLRKLEVFANSINHGSTFLKGVLARFSFLTDISDVISAREFLQFLFLSRDSLSLVSKSFNIQWHAFIHSDPSNDDRHCPYLSRTSRSSEQDKNSSFSLDTLRRHDTADRGWAQFTLHIQEVNESWQVPYNKPIVCPRIRKHS